MDKQIAKIPMALQLCLDDVAWHDGRDLRAIGQASRSGLPRMHSPLDYKVIDELGKSLNMKILCPLCLGDWDKDNLLRGEVGITHDPYGWDRASELDYDYANACFEALNGAEYLEFAYHGLIHGRYAEDGSLITQTEYFHMEKDKDGKRRCIPDGSDMKRRLDIFDKIYDSWGFSQKIRAFVAPCGLVGTLPEELLSEVVPNLTSRGVKYWANGGVPSERGMILFGDVICMKKGGSMNGKLIPWNAYDLDPKYIDHYSSDVNGKIVSGVMGMHWTNFLRFNPENNLERIPDWVAYFEGEAETLGIMLSRDIAFSSNQMLYNEYATVECDENGNTVTIDTAAITPIAPTWYERTFYISI